MASLAVNFNQLVDLAVNPSLGTINTSLLHNLLHVIINQMQLSSSFIEFQGSGSEVIENVIIKSQTECEFTIKEFEVSEMVDVATGNKIQHRQEILKPEHKTNTVFTIRNIESHAQCPTGYPLNPIQVLSTEEPHRDQRNSVHDVLTKILPSDEKFTKMENSGSSLKAMFDFINISKRLDALEIGIRQLADVMKQLKCDVEETRQFQHQTQSDLEELKEKLEHFSDGYATKTCKCDDEDYKIKLFKEIDEKLNGALSGAIGSLKADLERLMMLGDERHSELEANMKTFQESVCTRLESYQNDLVNAMTEVQEMLDAKLDKCFVPDLKQFIQVALHDLEEKIDNVDCQKSLAAGAVKKIIQNLNCISCGEKVVQADRPDLTQSKLTKIPSDVNMSELLKLPTRLCGGNHTITLPSERIFRSESCQSENCRN